MLIVSLNVLELCAHWTIEKLHVVEKNSEEVGKQKSHF